MARERRCRSSLWFPILIITITVTARGWAYRKKLTTALGTLKELVSECSSNKARVLVLKERCSGVCARRTGGEKRKVGPLIKTVYPSETLANGKLGWGIKIAWMVIFFCFTDGVNIWCAEKNWEIIIRGGVKGSAFRLCIILQWQKRPK